MRRTYTPGQPGEDAEEAYVRSAKAAVETPEGGDVRPDRGRVRRRGEGDEGHANPVARTKLKSGGGRPMVGTDGTVFFKRHSDDAPSQYAVASTRLARFLGMPDVIAHNAFARIKDVEGAVSGRVPGQPLVSFEFKGRRNFGPGYRAGPTPRSGEGRGAGQAGQQATTRGPAAVHQWVDYAEPGIQKGLSDLQLFDAISGQVDRHAGNIYVDAETGTVTGIDDDRAFGQGQNARDVAGQRKEQHYRGLPELVDAATADEILARDPDDLRRSWPAARTT